MIIDSLVYVIGRGYIDPSEVAVNDWVYALDKNVIKKIQVDSVQSDFYNDYINVISSGQSSCLATDDSRFLYVNGYGEYRYLKHEEIPKLTLDKAFGMDKYLPVLTTLDKQDRRYTDIELDGLARKIALGLDYEYDIANQLKTLQGIDNYILIEFLEHWASFDPGKGYGFNKTLVKSRAFVIQTKPVLDELCRVANFAGWTAEARHHKNQLFLAINFEATPLPGSIPKTKKYYREPYTGMVYNINAQNLPILGRTSHNKYRFIPTTSVKN